MGLNGTITLHKYYVITHGLLTTSILGAVFLFTIMEILLARFDVIFI